MTDGAPTIVLCNGAESPAKGARVIELNYLPVDKGPPNVRLDLPNFVLDVYHLPDRVLDLLEIAAYVYCADRRADRGRTDAVEYNAWARSIHFFVRVRDYEFWNRNAVSDALSKALTFMTGDSQYEFTFQRGHSTGQMNLFDSEKFDLYRHRNISIVLFSGGLDSLAGTIQCLQRNEDHLCLVSHQSQPSTKKTQDRLVWALNGYYEGRLSHYRFRCTLSGFRAAEETQRTRAFLYTSIAFAIASAFKENHITIYENGVTSINFQRRADLSNARTSRTTHPKTISHLREFFSLVLDQPLGHSGAAPVDNQDRSNGRACQRTSPRIDS